MGRLRGIELWAHESPGDSSSSFVHLEERIPPQEFPTDTSIYPFERIHAEKNIAVLLSSKSQNVAIEMMRP